ncbi:N-acetyltransferase [Amycolatopsis balhimycina DSM 5908]|uniref:N-acetyltransferase n=1 Tax=Amycolatopsis balhimycina DSM 5908 TaxID=1081091 RepID=A0A428WR79_AMYBA|nr:GNAT family N-acetyltransferase [Amycolatopsis balhimycina]RSM45549.1 N-acetyltransferase [Amycolatopsis balhimycina DSM 5908]
MRIFGDYELDDDRTRLDLDVVWKFLSTEAYWGRWRTREQVEAAIDGSWRVVGAYRGDEQAGFARAFSDGVSSAYLADVFVVGSARGSGLGKELVREMVDNGPGAGFRWMLHTADAHGLYRQFGFGEHTQGRYLEREGTFPAPLR